MNFKCKCYYNYFILGYFSNIPIKYRHQTHDSQAIEAARIGMRQSCAILQCLFCQPVKWICGKYKQEVGKSQAAEKTMAEI